MQDITKHLDKLKEKDDKEYKGALEMANIMLANIASGTGEMLQMVVFNQETGVHEIKTINNLKGMGLRGVSWPEKCYDAFIHSIPLDTLDAHFNTFGMNLMYGGGVTILEETLKNYARWAKIPLDKRVRLNYSTKYRFPIVERRQTKEIVSFWEPVPGEDGSIICLQGKWAPLALDADIKGKIRQAYRKGKPIEQLLPLMRECVKNRITTPELEDLLMQSEPRQINIHAVQDELWGLTWDPKQKEWKGLNYEGVLLMEYRKKLLAEREKEGKKKKKET